MRHTTTMSRLFALTLALTLGGRATAGEPQPPVPVQAQKPIPIQAQKSAPPVQPPPTVVVVNVVNVVNVFEAQRQLPPKPGAQKSVK